MRIYLAIFTLLLLSLGGCKDEESYSDLLRDEEKAVNWYLAQNKVALEIPENDDFLTGEEAPYYKMDDEGHLYMQVISKGEMSNRPATGDKIYFRFNRWNLKIMAEGGNAPAEGNMDNLNSFWKSSYFFLGSTIYPSTTQYGEGIQVPMKYFGYNCEVNLIIKSYTGFSIDQSQCIPYKYNVKYFKAEY